MNLVESTSNFMEEALVNMLKYILDVLGRVSVVDRTLYIIYVQPFRDGAFQKLEDAISELPFKSPRLEDLLDEIRGLLH